MDYIVYDAPEKCLRSAASYLLDRGYSIENRTEDSLTLSRNPEIGGGLVFWGCLATLFTAGGAILFALILIFLGVWKWKASVVAFSTTDGKTRLTVGGSNPAVEKTLQEWVVQELDVRPV